MVNGKFLAPTPINEAAVADDVIEAVELPERVDVDLVEELESNLEAFIIHAQQMMEEGDNEAAALLLAKRRAVRAALVFLKDLSIQCPVCRAHAPEDRANCPFCGGELLLKPRIVAVFEKQT